MTTFDQVDLTTAALCAWRENRGGRPVEDALQSVLNVIRNRMLKMGETAYKICTTHAQFSSMTMIDPETSLWPIEEDPIWIKSLMLAQQMLNGTLIDITLGSTNYYAPAGMKDGAAPSWAAHMTYVTTIAGQRFNN